MAVSLDGLGFAAINVDEPSAHLTLTGFQRFLFLTQFLEWTMMTMLAQSNLENQIHKGFQLPAIAIFITPY